MYYPLVLLAIPLRGYYTTAVKRAQQQQSKDTTEPAVFSYHYPTSACGADYAAFAYGIDSLTPPNTPPASQNGLAAPSAHSPGTHRKRRSVLPDPPTLQSSVHRTADRPSLRTALPGRSGRLRHLVLEKLIILRGPLSLRKSAPYRLQTALQVASGTK